MLVVAANILIPPLLSGPHEVAPVAETVLPTGAPLETNGVKTYTIDLGAAQRDERASTGDQAAQSAPDLPTVEVAPAPPPETPQAQRQTDEAPSKAPSAKVTETRRTPPTKTSSAEVAPSPPQPSESRSRDAVQNGGDWAVQVASFGARATADRIAGELRSKGFKSFVMPVQTKGQTLYRVRVGPVDTRESAEALLKRIKPLHANAAVVTQ